MGVNFVTHRLRRSGITPNGPKVREAIVCVIREADSRDLSVSQFDILKTLFVADKEHLNKYGRPITFDEYVAMPDGPVPSLAYDLLKDALEAQREAGIESPLWKSMSDGGKKKRFFEASRDSSDDILSESDVEELIAALIKIKSWGYKKTWDYVHADPAYIEAWEKRGNSQHHHMEYSMILNTRDADQADDIKFLSSHL